MEGKTSTDMSYYDFLFTIQKIIMMFADLKPI
jgi:hypothetical protein